MRLIDKNVHTDTHIHADVLSIKVSNLMTYSVNFNF